MAEADLLQHQLIQEQNADGGWGYVHSSSWTEPTALALLALQAHGNQASQYKRGCAWLAQTQRSDGGWAPHPSVHISTWVTSLASLALSDVRSHGVNWNSGNEWLAQQIKPESTPLERFVRRLRDSAPEFQPGGGSPWFPGTAPWITPTAFSILAFSQATRSDPDRFRKLIFAGQQYLLSRRCRDGGWNHGSSRYRSENANSYPETTGLALLALSGVPPRQLDVPLKRAAAFFQAPGSVEGSTWLQLALAKHGRNSNPPAAIPPCRTTRDLSLRLLALAPSSASKLTSL